MDRNVYSAPWRLGSSAEHGYLFAFGDVSVATVDHQTGAFILRTNSRQPQLYFHNSSQRCPPRFQREKLSWPMDKNFSNDDLCNPATVSFGNSLNFESLEISNPSFNSLCSSPRPILARSEEKPLAIENSEPSVTSPRKSPVSRNNQQGHSIQPNLFNQQHAATASKALDFELPNNSSDETSATPSIIPEELQWDKMSLEIWKYYENNKQPVDLFLKKLKFKDDVHRILRCIYPDCNLVIVGSSVTGLGTKTSDMDLCLILAPHEIEQRIAATHLLMYAQEILTKCAFIKSIELIAAKVPILKFTDANEEVHVELNINNVVGVSNTKLITKYCQLDWRVQPLVVAVKKWAQSWNINNAKETTLSSYSLVLMTIHYLQCGCEPPVLPCLQNKGLRKILPAGYADFQNRHPAKLRNTESLSHLLFGFFNYFCHKFDFFNDVASVRLGCKLPKHVAMNYMTPRNKKGHWKYICVEEPFNRTNTAFAVFKPESFDRIILAFKYTYFKLKSGKK